MIKYILFDLDGTLLPMDQNVFVHDYFSRLARHIAPIGYPPETLFQNLWKGVGAMVMNDGSVK
jgi:FMN phosphatase YigB (HAD superfamily)